MNKKNIILALFFILLLGTSVTVNAQPKTMKDGTVFDAEYYANTYSDVREALGNNELDLYNHYVQYGKAEGRLPYAQNTEKATSTQTLIDNFDAKYYAKNNPDVVAALGDDEDALYKHYVEHGKKEGRLSNSSATSSKENVVKTESKTAVKTKTKATVTVPAQNETKGILVWVPTKGGTKYHKASGCSSMKNPMQVSIDIAKSNGYTPCKKCYK